MEKISLLEDWLFRIHRMQILHFEASQYYNNLHKKFGVPAIILSSIVGTSIFASLLENTSIAGEKGKSYEWAFISIKIVTGILSISSATFAALQTFYRFDEMSEKHKLAGAKFAALRIELEYELNYGGQNNSQVFAENFRGKWAEVQNASPTLPDKIIKPVVRSFKKTNPEMSKRNRMTL